MLPQNAGLCSCLKEKPKSMTPVLSMRRPRNEAFLVH